MPATENTYDPLHVLNAAWETRNNDRQTVAKAREIFQTWLESWRFGTANTKSLMQAGVILQQMDGAFWLDFLGCEMACRKRVSDLGLLKPAVAADLDFAAEVMALKLLLAAVAGEEAVLDRQLKVVTHAGQLERVFEAVQSIRDRLECWIILRMEPPSPWIMDAELSPRVPGPHRRFFSTQY